MTTKELGNLGEKLACEYLVDKGFNILGKNWSLPAGGRGSIFGEIDIIARKKPKLFARFFGGGDKTIHFVEVKTIVRKEGFFPEDRVDYKKRQKLRHLAQIWLQKNKYPQNTPYQIDVIAITTEADFQSPVIEYFQNAIEGSDYF